MKMFDQRHVESSVSSTFGRFAIGKEMNENVESFNAFGAFERVVGEVGEVALYGAFVGKYHIELI